MGMFFAEDPAHSDGGRLTGFDRYREVLERDFISFMLCGLVTLVFFLPFALGMAYAVLSTSVMMMFVASVVGGLFAGPGIYGMYDLLFRSLRDAPGKWWKSYKKALAENWKSALLPGVVFCLFLGIIIFAGLLMFWWAETLPSWGTIVVYVVSTLITTMVFAVYWPQLVLFKQSNFLRFKNCLLFCIKYFWHTLGVSAIEVVYWAVIALFLPWSMLVMPIIGLWFVLFLANFLLYNDLNQAFQIEEGIKEHFPEQAPCYDDPWEVDEE